MKTAEIRSRFLKYFERSGYLLSSIGEKTPWRLKLRTPSFTNVQALARSLPGTGLHALGPAVTSFFFVVGDVDR